jgi:hypothetical protein
MIGIVIVSSFILGFLGSYVAKEKNRSGTEGFLLGFLFSFLGVIIVALLPTKEKPKEIVINKVGCVSTYFYMKNKLLLTIGF